MATNAPNVKKRYNGYFVDLFVRQSNKVAITMYEKFGYIKYRTVLGYYSGQEDAYGLFLSLIIVASI